MFAPPLFSQPPSLLPRSGNANALQYPPKANIIRKINQLEEPPKFNTFPVPPGTDFSPLCRSGLPDVFFPERGCASGLGSQRVGGGNGALQRSSKASEGWKCRTFPRPHPHPHPRCRSQTQLLPLQLFPPQIRHPFGKQCSLVNHLMK